MVIEALWFTRPSKCFPSLTILFPDEHSPDVKRI
jgi:hypothetical protein